MHIGHTGCSFAFFTNVLWRIHLKSHDLFLKMEGGGNPFCMNWEERDYVLPGVLCLIKAEFRVREKTLPATLPLYQED